MHVSLSRRHLPRKVSHHITDDENPTAGRFSLDGRTFMTCTSSGHVQLYDVEGRRLVLTKSLVLGEPLNMFKGNAYVYMSASPDGEFVAFTSKHGKRIPSNWIYPSIIVNYTEVSIGSVLICHTI